MPLAPSLFCSSQRCVSCPHWQCSAAACWYYRMCGHSPAVVTFIFISASHPDFLSFFPCLLSVLFLQTVSHGCLWCWTCAFCFSSITTSNAITYFPLSATKLQACIQFLCNSIVVLFFQMLVQFYIYVTTFCEDCLY